MEQSSNEPESNNKKKVNEDLVVFMRKRSDHEVPRYTARLKTYVDIQRKRRRAAAARRNSEHSCADKPTSASGLRKKNTDEQKDKTENGGEETGGNETDRGGHANSEDDDTKGRSVTNCVEPISSLNLCSIMPSSSESVNLRKSSSAKMRGWFGRRGGEEKQTRGRSMSRSRSDIDPSDGCCRRRRRRCCRRRRRCSRRRRRCRRRRRRCSRRRRRRCSRRRRRKRC